MAKCDEGYPCQICGEDVENIAQSDLYLRYVIGMVDPEVLHTSAERHIACNPALAQFIVADGFDTPTIDGDFDKRSLDADFVSERERLVTAGWHRLREIQANQEELSVLEYPLASVKARMNSRFGG